MTAKLLFLHDFARAGAASQTRVNGYLRRAAGLSVSPRTPAAACQILRLRPRLECQWTINPVTGALRAHWVRRAADRGTGTSARDFVEDRRRLRPELAIAGSPGAPRLAA
jgi:hypothetical protein